MSPLKLILMTPPYPPDERLGKLSIIGGRLPSISLLYLATAVRNLCEVQIVDAASQDLSEDQVLESIARFAPRVVGISAVTPSIARAQAMAARIKERFPGVLTVLGGPHITTVPLETMEQTPAIDVGVVGEGEYTLQELVTRFDGSTASIADIKGTIVRGAGGELTVNEPRELIQNIDELGMPAYDLVENISRVRPALFKTRRLPAIHAITSRGCAHTCTYCNTNLFNKRVRFHSAAYVIELIRYLMSMGFRELSFEDDNFTANRKRLHEVCNYLISNEIGLHWSVNARIDTVDEDTLRLMKRAGCWYISYGIESGSEETLRRINKNLKKEQISRIVEITRAVGIEAKGFFIIGFPWETPELVNETMSFALELRLSDVNVFPLTPFRGTPIYQEAKESGSFDDDWRKMDLQQIVYVPAGLSVEFMLGSIKKFLTGFYFRPRTIANYLKRSLNAIPVIMRVLKELTVPGRDAGQ